jgi:N-acetyl-gamma-glutamylphosphate reductase
MLRDVIVAMMLASYTCFPPQGTVARIVNNVCDMTVRVVRSQIVMLACLDNLIKGAAGVAVQNLNLMLDCAEATALF